VIAVALAAAACGGEHAKRLSPKPGQVWTSSAEPSPPGSAGRWSPADEWQLDHSSP